MRSVGISFSIFMAKTALIVTIASLTDRALGVAAVSALAALALNKIESDVPPKPKRRSEVSPTTAPSAPLRL